MHVTYSVIDPINLSLRTSPLQCTADEQNTLQKPSPNNPARLQVCSDTELTDIDYQCGTLRIMVAIQLSFTSQKWAVHSLTANVSAAIPMYIHSCTCTYVRTYVHRYVRTYTQHISLDPLEYMKICQQINIHIENVTAYSIPWSLLVLWSIFVINRTCMHSYTSGVPTSHQHSLNIRLYGTLKPFYVILWTWGTMIPSYLET